jgi:hypothetical protein
VKGKDTWVDAPGDNFSYAPIRPAVLTIPDGAPPPAASSMVKGGIVVGIKGGNLVVYIKDDAGNVQVLTNAPHFPIIDTLTNDSLQLPNPGVDQSSDLIQGLINSGQITSAADLDPSDLIIITDSGNPDRSPNVGPGTYIWDGTQFLQQAIGAPPPVSHAVYDLANNSISLPSPGTDLQNDLISGLINHGTISRPLDLHLGDLVIVTNSGQPNVSNVEVGTYVWNGTQFFNIPTDASGVGTIEVKGQWSFNYIPTLEELP